VYLFLARPLATVAFLSFLWLPALGQQTPLPKPAPSDPPVETSGSSPIVAPLAAQDASPPTPQAGNITGTVTDVIGDVLSGATVTLQGAGLKDPRSVLSDDDGGFAFTKLDPGTYHITVTGKDFADWSSPEIVINPGQFLILSEVKLQVAEAITTVRVEGSQEEVATEQVKIEETQRVFGIIPNFYVVYDPNPVALTTKLKFQLALRTSVDVVTILGTACWLRSTRRATRRTINRDGRGMASALARSLPTAFPTS